VPDRFCERVRAAKHAPRDWFYFRERPNGFAEIVECGGGVSEVPEGLGPGSVFPVDVPGRGACRVTVPPGVFAGQTFTLLHPDYVGTSN
jgi:hypothetical protein